MEKELLSIENLEIVYQTKHEAVHAVNGISLRLQEGKTLGLVGETGAGKTTTALSILRLLPDRTARITKGRILFHGEDLLALPIHEMLRIRGHKISMIFQDPMTALNPVITVGDQIKEALELHNEDHLNSEQLDAKVDEVLEMVGISARRKREYPHQFSGGMKQRVIIAMALVCNPELLIADEPTTALDVTIQAQVLAMMNDLKKRLNTSMIMITHDLGIVARICDNVAIMYAGEIIEQGTVEDLFTPALPHHPYTVGLFGAIPNLEEDTDRLHPIEGLMPDPTDLPSGCKFSPRCPCCVERCRQEAPNAWRDGTHSICCHFIEEVSAQ